MNRMVFLITTLAINAATFAADTDGTQEPPSVFEGTIAQSVAAVIVFLVLLGVLYKKAWGPILTGLQDRENKIKSDLESAEKQAVEAAQTLDAYRTQLKEAQAEAAGLIEQARKDAEQVAAKLRSDTEADIKSIKDRATSDIASAKEQAVKDIYAQAAQLSTTIAGRILQREINADDQQQLVQASLNELGNVSQN